MIMPDAIEETLSLYLKGGLHTFDPDVARKAPRYKDPVKREINKLISSRRTQLYQGRRPPFQILEVEKSSSDDSRYLKLLGIYETFDGVAIDITFEGRYGDPSEKGPPNWLKPEDCFKSFDLEARVGNADSRQSGIFSQITLYTEESRFSNGTLRRTFRQRDYDPVNAGLYIVRQIGEIAAVYEHLHFPPVLLSLEEQRQRYVESLESIGENAIDINISIKESPAFRRGYAYFFPYVRFSSTKKEGPMAIALMDQVPNEPYSVTFEYGTELAMEDNYWNVIMEGPELMTLVNLPYETRIGDLELPENVAKVTTTLKFIMDGLMFTAVDPGDPISNMYKSMFDDALVKAREEIKQSNPGYQPLVTIFGEENRHVMERGFERDPETLEFGSLEAYHAFDSLFSLFRQRPFIDIDGLVFDPEVRRRLDLYPDIKRRFMTYYDCHKQDPKNAFSLFRALDPAYTRAQEIHEKYVEELHKKAEESKNATSA